MRGKLFLNRYLEDRIVCARFSFGDIIYVSARAFVCVLQFCTLRILTDCEKQLLAVFFFNDSNVSARSLMCVFG